MKSYLSVDLDYWGMSSNSESSVVRFLNRIERLNKPIFVKPSHEQILENLNKYKVNYLYQIDFHSDLVEDDVEEFQEGTWANFYNYRKNCIFEWRYPNYKECFVNRLGRCDLSQYDNSTWPIKRFPYKKVIRKQGTSGINWSSIEAIGICLSTWWWYSDDISFVFDRYSFLKRFKKQKKYIASVHRKEL